MQQEPESRLDNRIERSRKAMREALLRRLEDHRFEDITIREIVAEAGIGYATYFRHYEDKRALLNDLASSQIRELLGLTMPIFYEKDSLAACEALCRYVHDRRRLWTTLLTGGAAGTLREAFLEEAKKMVPADAPVDARLPNDLKVAVAVAGVVELLAWWLGAAESRALDEVAEMMDRLVIRPVITV